MALFSRNKEKESKELEAQETKGQKEKTPVHKTAVNTASVTDRDLSSVFIKPRITEKAVQKGESNVYTFVIRKNATKYDVRDAVKELFNVTPVKVNIVNQSPRQYMSRSKGRTVTQKGVKKAYVYLQAGDSIELT